MSCVLKERKKQSQEKGSLGSGTGAGTGAGTGPGAGPGAGTTMGWGMVVGKHGLGQRYGQTWVGMGSRTNMGWDMDVARTGLDCPPPHDGVEIARDVITHLGNNCQTDVLGTE